MNKILFLLQLPPPVHGASVMNQHVVNIFHKSSYENKIIELRFVENVADIGSINFRKLLKMFVIAFNILNVMKSFKPDIVYFTLSPVGGAFYRDVLYIAILKIFGVKILYHLHGKGIKDNLASWWKKKLYKFVFKKSFIIHLSPELEKDILGLGYEHIYFVPNGIEQIERDIENKKTSGILKLLYLSNLTISKGLLILIEACKILKETNFEFQLNIVGKEFDITYNALNKKIQEYNLNEFVQVLGPKYGGEKYQILNNSDVLIFPTFYPNECFPLVTLEAMQFGIPIVSTFEGAIPEIVDDEITGFLVLQKDAKALADKIEILIKDKKLREKMGQAGREKFLERYTLEKFEENMKKVFEEVMSR